MKPCLFVLLTTGLFVSSGCGDMGGGSRRNASGAVGGAGLVAPDQQVSQPPVAAPAQPQATPGSALSAAAQLGQGASLQPGAPADQLPPALAPDANAPPAAVPQPNMVQEKAQAGVTGKGNYEPGLVTTPIATYFQAKERIVFEIQIPQAMNLYAAEKGHKPRTQEEFMRDIIQANLIKLPELPPGHKYVYDPQKGELMVEHPQ